MDHSSHHIVEKFSCRGFLSKALIVATVLAIACAPLGAQTKASPELPTGGIPLTSTITKPVEVRTAGRSEKVVRTKALAGDTASSIAHRWNVAIEAVVRLNSIASDVELPEGKEILVPPPPSIRGKRSRQSNEKADVLAQTNRPTLTLNDKSVIRADEMWQDASGYWYRRDGVAHFVDKTRVKAYEAATKAEPGGPDSDTGIKVVEASNDTALINEGAVWIYLQGGAKVEADEVNETAGGAWYRRGNLSIFVEKSRIERIERESAQSLAAKGSKRRWSERGWGTGNSRLDNLIRQNGSRFGVDPYFIFCVMEQESHFNSRAVSPVGAKGLMQLMPGTAARFGVRRPMDPSQNIAGGTRYLKMLLETHSGRIDLALASYNAGEGAVARYGGRVPPYRETRNYVRKISKQYDKIKPEAEAKTAADNGVATKMR
jgi:hypothetical protein